MNRNTRSVATRWTTWTLALVLLALVPGWAQAAEGAGTFKVPGTWDLGPVRRIVYVG